MFVELKLRLNDEGYKQWMKAGWCLQQLRDCVLSFVRAEIGSFHCSLLHSNSALSQHHLCTQACKPQATKFQWACLLCEEWKREILRHHTHQNGIIYWANCNPQLWPTHPWEVAKVYMPRGQMNKQGPENCDVAALLNLINFCDHFGFVEHQKVIEVIKCRNELMHSTEMSVSVKWLESSVKKILDLLQEFQHVAETKSTSQIIQKIMSSNWKVQIPGMDVVDDGRALEVSDEELNAEEIHNVELRLVREKLQDLCFILGEQKEFQEQDLNCLRRLKEFLKDNREFERELHDDLQQLYELEMKLNSVPGPAAEDESERK